MPLSATQRAAVAAHHPVIDGANGSTDRAIIAGIVESETSLPSFTAQQRAAVAARHIVIDGSIDRDDRATVAGVVEPDTAAGAVTETFETSWFLSYTAVMTPLPQSNVGSISIALGSLIARLRDETPEPVDVQRVTRLTFTSKTKSLSGSATKKAIAASPSQKSTVANSATQLITGSSTTKSITASSKTKSIIISG